MTGPVGFDVKVREWWSLLRFWGCCISAHQSQALGAVTEPMATKETPHAVARDLDAAPLRATQLQADPVRTPTRECNCHSQDPLLNHGRDRVRHPRLTPLPRPQQLGAVSEQQASPAVIGGVVDTEHPAGCSHTAHLLGQSEQTKSTAIDDVIIGHRWRLLWGGEVPTEWRRRVLPGRASRCRVYSERGHPSGRRASDPPLDLGPQGWPERRSAARTGSCCSRCYWFIARRISARS